MNNIINIPQRDADRTVIEAEARLWLVQLDGHRPAPEELREFRDWLARSPFHQEAFRRAAAAWNELDALSTLLDEQRPRTTSGGARLLAALCSHPALTGIVLAVGLLAALAVFLNTPSALHQQSSSGVYATAIGESRSVRLADGSGVRLNTDSHIRTAYARGARIVHLLKGEAWFDVARDPDRPFIVYAGKVAVRAVGTAFSVRVRDNKVDLTVTNGRIEVSSFKKAVSTGKDLDPRRLKDAVARVPLVEGQYVVFDNDLEIELVQSMEPQQIEKRLSWRDGMLIFDNDTLEEVVAEINRYTPKKIVISDPQIRNLRFGGYFRASDVSSILATFEEGFGIRVEEVNPGLVYLSRRQNSD